MDFEQIIPILTGFNSGSIFIFFLGAVIGSFLNVCIYRIPLGESIMFPPSFCPECKNKIKSYDNIPIVGYLLLSGRCRSCNVSISPQEPFIEALSGFFAVLVFYKFGATTDALLYFLFISVLIIIAFIDLRHQIIPDELTLSGIIVGLGSSFFLKDLTFLDSLLGILGGGGALFLVSYMYEKVRGIEGMGGGDIKLVSMLGAFLGWKAVILTIFIGSFIGAVIGLVIMLIENKDLKYAVPFGPFLAAGAVFCLFLGKDFIALYL